VFCSWATRCLRSCASRLLRVPALTCNVTTAQIILRRGGYDAQAADVWAAGVLLWALVSGGFAFLRPDEEALEPAARMRAMAPRIVTGAYRTLPVEVCNLIVALFTVVHPASHV